MLLPSNALKVKTTLAAAVMLLASFAIWGQAQKQPLPKSETPDAGDAVFTSDTRLVPLNVTVTNKVGHLLPGLEKSAFQVYENNVLQQIKDFKSEDVPVSLGLESSTTAEVCARSAKAWNRRRWRWFAIPIFRMKCLS
jgi:hypothetical protein